MKCPFYTHFTVPSAPPQSPNGVANSPNQVTLTWSPPPGVDVNGDLQYYALRVTEVETRRQWTFYTVDTFITIGGLHPYFNYRCQVAAHTVIGSGPFTDPFYVQTQESGMFVTLLHTCLYDYMHLVGDCVLSLFQLPLHHHLFHSWQHLLLSHSLLCGNHLHLNR